MELKPIVLSDVFELSTRISAILKDMQDVQVDQNVSVMVLSNIEKFLPVLPIFTNNQMTEEDIKQLSLKGIAELVDNILEVNEIDQVVGLFQRISKKVQPAKKA